MARDLLTIEHHEFGTATFGIESATFSLYQRDDGVSEFLVRARTRW